MSRVYASSRNTRCSCRISELAERAGAARPWSEGWAQNVRFTRRGRIDGDCHDIVARDRPAIDVARTKSRYLGVGATLRDERTWERAQSPGWSRRR